MRNAELVQDKDSITLLDKDVQQCPYHANKKLREEHPVYLDPATGFHIISRFEDIKRVLKLSLIHISEPTRPY